MAVDGHVANFPVGNESRREASRLGNRDKGKRQGYEKRVGSVSSETIETDFVISQRCCVLAISSRGISAIIVQPVGVAPRLLTALISIAINANICEVFHVCVIMLSSGSSVCQVCVKCVSSLFQVCQVYVK